MPALPSVESCYTKLEGFEPEALQLRNELLRQKFEKEGVISQTSDVLTLCDEQLHMATIRRTRVGEPWHREPTQTLEAREFENTKRTEDTAAKERMNNMLDFLSEQGVKHVKVDLAINQHAEMLVAYNVDKTIPDARNRMAQFLNDSFFVEASLVTQDSRIYQANTMDSVKEDEQGHLIIAEREQIARGFDHMEKALAERGIELTVDDGHDYDKVNSAYQASLAEKAPAAKPAVTPETEAPVPPTRPGTPG